ncbi:MAG: cysteine rich repeat-containing protein [Rhodomicrobium sp.]
MKIALFASLAAALLIVTPQLASAQQGHACKADREKLCPGMTFGDGKLGACLKEHEAELSPECAAARMAAQEARKAVRMNCKADSEKFCADAGTGHGEKMKCLKSHSSELGQACADALNALPGAKK